MVIRGILKKEIFSGDNGYLVALVEDIDNDEEIVIVGYLKIFPKQIYKYEGELQEHNSYGEQLLVNKYTLEVPKNGDEIINFLSSKSFDNIGKRTAKKIYDFFGEETIDVLKNTPQMVKDEVNIKEELVDQITYTLNSLDGMETLYKLLNPLGITDFFINEVFQYVNEHNILSVENLVKNETFKLLLIPNFTFDRADKIFLYYNENQKDKYRIKSAILDEIDQMCVSSGNTYVLYNDLYNAVNKKLQFILEDFEMYINELYKKEEIYIDEDFVILKKYYLAEKQIASNIINRLSFLSLGMDKDIIDGQISSIEKKERVNYSDLQKKAIINSLSNNISIITGGPGTGKTTIINAVVKIFEKLKYDGEIIKDISTKIILCAPTGRAAQRMKEATGYSSKTIHSLLEWDPYKNDFNKDQTNPLIQDLVIIDEFSMVDIFLAAAMFRAMKPNALVVIVGDSAQLESVNPGNVLYDLINSHKISTVHLEKIFRQGEGSSIAQFAKDINLGTEVEFLNTGDMSLIDRKHNLVDIVKNIVDKSYDSGYDDMDVQVLYPKYGGKNGIDKLNKMLLQNLDQKSIVAYENTFYLHDKVMQLKNNYDKKIYNGDIGRITKVYTARSNNDLALEVTFKENKINFTKKELIDLKHAYAISIHKSQGSEFKVIILPISKESENMLNKKLIYTAITRAKEKLIVIGDLNCFKDSIKLEEKNRKTYLEKLLKKYS